MDKKVKIVGSLNYDKLKNLSTEERNSFIKIFNRKTDG